MAVSFAAMEAGAPPPPGAAAADDETSRQSKETEKSRPSTETAAEAKAADAEPSRPSTETETTESLRFRNNDTVVAEGENDKSYDDGNKLGGGDDDEESSDSGGRRDGLGGGCAAKLTAAGDATASAADAASLASAASLAGAPSTAAEAKAADANGSPPVTSDVSQQELPPQPPPRAVWQQGESGDPTASTAASSSDDEDLPLDERKRKNDEQRLRVARMKQAPLPSLPSVGDAVEVNWKDWGWCAGTVVAISDGRLKNPQYKRRGTKEKKMQLVPKDGFVIKYKEGEYWCHLKPELQGGNQFEAWRFLPSSTETSAGVNLSSSRASKFSRTGARCSEITACVTETECETGNPDCPDVCQDATTDVPKASVTNRYCACGKLAELRCSTDNCFRRRCLECQRLPSIQPWRCDECRAKSKDDHTPSWRIADLQPASKCLYCQCALDIIQDADTGAAVSNHVDCRRCGCSLCLDCACIPDEQKYIESFECCPCLGFEVYIELRIKIIDDISSRFKPTSINWKNDDLRNLADQLGLMFYNCRMKNLYHVVLHAFPLMLKVLKSQQQGAAALPSVHPSQFMSLMGLHSHANLALFKGISSTYSVYTNSGAKKVARAAGVLKPFARAPEPSEIMTLAILSCNFGNHPLLHMYYRPIRTWLQNPRLKVVLIAVGNVDREYGLVQELISAVEDSETGELVEFPVINDGNLACVIKELRDRQIFAGLDLVGSASGYELVAQLIAIGYATEQMHHLNYPGAQYPKDGRGNSRMVADQITWSDECSRVPGAEDICMVSCWMNPLTEEVSIDMTSSREQFGLIPGKLYWVFDASNSKLDPDALVMLADALSENPDVLIWILDSPEYGFMNIMHYMKEEKILKDSCEDRVIRGEYLPREQHLTRLSAFVNDSGGAIFPICCCSWPPHTTMQESVMLGLFPICFLDRWWGFPARVPAAVMYYCGLGDLVAHEKGRFSQLLRHWSDPGQRQELLRVSRELRSDFRNQTGFWKPDRASDEILNAFRKLAGMQPADKPKILDARLDAYPPSPSRFPVENAGWKSQTPLDLNETVETAMKKIDALQKFRTNDQMNHVREILWYVVITLRLYPRDVIGCGGFCMAIALVDCFGVLYALKLEFHKLFPRFNLHNSEIMRSAFAEHEVGRRLRNNSAVSPAQAPNVFKFALGHTQPDKTGLSVAFSIREHLGETFHHSVKGWFASWRETGEFGDEVRTAFVTATFGLGTLNSAKISLLDVSPNNLYIQNNKLRITDMGCAGVFEFKANQEHRQPELVDRNRTSFSFDDVREVQAAGRRAAKSKTCKSPRTPQLITSGQVARFFQRRTEDKESLAWLRDATRPFRVAVDSDLPVNAALGAYIDRCALVRLLLWELAPVQGDEDPSAWDREVSAIDSAAGFNAFILNRMREPLRKDHPRQPLMWERLLDFILKGLMPFVSNRQGEQDTNAKLSDLAVHRFLAMPILDPCDDRALHGGGSIVIAGGDLYGMGIPDVFIGKRIEQTLLRLSPGKGLGVFADKDMHYGDIAGIYICSRVLRSDGVESRFSVSCIGVGEDLYYYESRFTSTMTVRFYTDKKRSCGPFVNGAWSGLEGTANCKLDRTNGWDDQDQDLGRALKIFPLIVDKREGIKKGEELLWKYDPHQGRGRQFPIGY